MESRDDMLLDKAYLSYHLDSSSLHKIQLFLKNHTPSGMIPVSMPHLTLDYHEKMHLDTLQLLAFWVNLSPLLYGNIVAANVRSILSLGELSHLRSDVTGEDIFYIPVLNDAAEDSPDFMESLQLQWNSLRTPHITLFKGFNTSDECIKRTINSLKEIIPTDISLDSSTVFIHGKREDGMPYVSSFQKWKIRD